MTKRLTICVLWFLAVWAVGGIAVVALDVPRVLILIPAIGAAAAWYVGLGRYEVWVADRRERADASIRRVVAARMATPTLDTLPR